MQRSEDRWDDHRHRCKPERKTIALRRLHPLIAFLNRAIPSITCLMLITSGAAGQEFSVQHWTTRNGLRTSAVASITQTMDGDLWIGTRAGLARFDGSEFKVFTPRNLPGLSSRFVNYVATGPDSTLYVGTDDRLCVFSRGHSRSFAMQRGEKASKALVILPVDKDEAWIGTGFGVLFHYKNGAVKEAGFRFPSEAAISGLAKTPDGTLWLATDIGLFSLSQGKMARYQPKVPLPVQAFYDLSVSPDGTLFAASSLGLFGIRGSQWKQWTKASGLPSNELNVLTTDAHGVLWIGTRAGLARLEGGTVRRVNSVSCSVHALFVDAQKSLWLGCEDLVGLFRLRSDEFRYLSPPQPFSLASASLAVDSTGAVWMGSRRGLYKYANGRFQIYTHEDGLPNDLVWDVSVTRSDVVWVATGDGLTRIDKGRIEPIRSKEKGLSGAFFHVVESLDGTLWATSEQGLSRRLPGRTVMSLEPGFTNFVESMYQDRSGALWVSTDLHGLFRFAGGTKKAFLKACGIGSDTVYSTVQDDSGTMWAWTYGGLSRIRDDKCANISPDAGLPHGEAGAITYDGTGHLWLRTQYGLVAIDVAEANDVIGSPGPLLKTRFVGSEEGLDEAFDDMETLKLVMLPAAHQVWIPTAAGIAVFDTSSVQRPTSDMRPQITSIVSDSGEHDITAPVSLQPDDIHLQFTYRVPSLLGVRGRMYRYQLVGFDKGWREGQESGDAVYTSIPVGTYKFLVSSREPFEVWRTVSRPVEVTMLPHFYQTWWWYALLVLSATVAIWLGYWIRLLAVRKQYAAVFAERDHERSRLARELHDTLSRGMMSIHMQLQLVRTFLPAKPDAACTHLDTAIGIVRESASETRKSIAALRSTGESGSLRDLLDRTAGSFRTAGNISLQLDIDSGLPSLPADVTHEVARIFEEALTNVRQHSGARQARLSARTSGKMLEIQVSDDGCGFDPDDSHPERFGIRGMKERAERIHANLGIRSMSGEGTTVTLEVPLNRGRRHSRWQRFCGSVPASSDTHVEKRG